MDIWGLILVLFWACCNCYNCFHFKYVIAFAGLLLGTTPGGSSRIEFNGNSACLSYEYGSSPAVVWMLQRKAAEEKLGEWDSGHTVIFCVILA